MSDDGQCGRLPIAKNCKRVAVAGTEAVKMAQRFLLSEAPSRFSIGISLRITNPEPDFSARLAAFAERCKLSTLAAVELPPPGRFVDASTPKSFPYGPLVVFVPPKMARWLGNCCSLSAVLLKRW